MHYTIHLYLGLNFSIFSNGLSTSVAVLKKKKQLSKAIKGQNTKLLVDYLP